MNTKVVDKHGNLTPHFIGVILGRIRAEAVQQFIDNGGSFVGGDRRKPMLRNGASAKEDYAGHVIAMIDHLPPRPCAVWMKLIELGGMIAKSGWAHYYDTAKAQTTGRSKAGKITAEPRKSAKAERTREIQAEYLKQFAGRKKDWAATKLAEQFAGRKGFSIGLIKTAISTNALQKMQDA